MSAADTTLQAIRIRAEAPIPRHRITQADKDRRALMGLVDGLQLALHQLRDHHAIAHPDCEPRA